MRLDCVIREPMIERDTMANWSEHAERFAGKRWWINWMAFITLKKPCLRVVPDIANAQDYDSAM